MNAIIPFAFEDRLFRAIDRGGDPWFIAGDVAKILGHRDAADLAKRLDADERGTDIVRTPGGDQKILVVSEPGLYRVIIQRRRSNRLTASTRDFIVRFQRWVFHEVLPSLRRTGSYAMPGAAAAPDGEMVLRSEEQKLALVREARLTFGIAMAQKVWRRLGVFGEFDPVPSSVAIDVEGIDAFLDLRVCEEADHRLSAAAVYEAYRTWCADAGRPVLSQARFGKRMRQRFARSEIGGRLWYHGCALYDPPTLD